MQSVRRVSQQMMLRWPQMVYRPYFMATAKAGKKKIDWEEIYQKKTPIEHVLLRPDTYVGSIESNLHERWVISSSNSMILRDVDYVPALYKIFDEVLVNACDNFHRPSSGQTRIDVTVDPATGVISVFNDGRTIPILMHKTEKVYMPELVFGHLLTGSNFDDSVAKATGGRNGYGAKLANIFSKWFQVEIWDADHQLEYKQKWTKNMSTVGEPKISKLKKGSVGGGTQVSFCPDLARFSTKAGSLEDGADILSVFQSRCYDIAACNKGLTVTFNGKELPSSFESYFRLYDLPSLLGSVFTTFGKDWEVGIGVVEASSSLSHVSFVNSINTLKGGTHVNFIADSLSKSIAAVMKKDSSLPVVSPAFIKSHLVIFVNCHVENPAFDSQTKESLTTKTETIRKVCKIPDSFVARLIEETPIVEIVTKYARLREDNKSRVRKGVRLQGIPKLEDANKAGSAKESSKCTLIITEGDSAKALAVAGLSIVGRDYYGVYPLRGKFLNVHDANHKKVNENKEAMELKRILGLQSHVDYSTEEGRKSLRYGRVMLMTDQDVDGSHIKGLFINFIHVLFPTLIHANGFLMEFVTPLVKASKGKQSHWFFSVSEYRAWWEEDDRSSWKIKYYKGLGTSSSAEAREYFSDLDRHVKSFQWISKEDDDAIRLAFGKGDGTTATDKRKRWLEAYNPDVFVDRATGEPFLSYSDFVNKELVSFSYYSNLRSIPNVFDGLKLGQRKVLYSCFRKNLKANEEIKVVQLAGYVSEVAAYHHGETALHGTIVHMAGSFVGSNNNIPLLRGIGQFGTRLQGGKDAASARYIFCGMGKYTRDLIREEDDSLLQYEEEDGEFVQPKHYMPVLPTILINGQEGVGTGWSTSVPPYNPEEVIENMMLMLDDKPLKDMVPWFRGYKGDISYNKKLDCYFTKGNVILEDKGVLRITELPVGKWTQDYKELLDNMLTGKSTKSGQENILKNYTEHHTETKVDFRLKLTNHASNRFATPKGKEQIIAALNLVSRFKTSNMHLWGPDGTIKRYNSPQEVIRDFFPVRLKYYEERKKRLEEHLGRVLTDLQNKHRFCKMVIDGSLKLFKKSKKEIEQILKDLGFAMQNKSFSYLLGISMLDLTTDRLVELEKKLELREKELEGLKKKTPRALWKDDLKQLSKKLAKEKD